MKYIDYVNLNPFEKLGYNLKTFFVALPGNIVKVLQSDRQLLQEARHRYRQGRKRLLLQIRQG